MQVSVVVPVWNPGPNFQRCIDSLLAQTLPREQYEIVLVDDESTDGTAERLDLLAERYPGLVRVLHIPGSGWPGRPRNVGIDAARGEFVHLVDNDDTLPPYALERMVAAGQENDADVVLGRPASDFRGLVHNIYRRPVWTGSLREFPELTTTLTPHKMFRRALLDEHKIRFPEGRVPLEDQMFVMAAYLYARRITVLSDRVYYSYLRRVGSGRNAGDSPIDALVQSRAVEQVLDIVEDALAGTGGDDEFRDVLFRRFYRINLLPRLTDEAIMEGPERDRVVDEVRRVTTARFGPGVTEQVGAAHRALGHLLRTGDTSALVATAAQYRAVGLRSAVTDLQWRDGALHLELDGGVTLRGELLRCDAVDSGWALPATLVPGVPAEDRAFDAARDEADVELSVIDRISSASFAAETDLRLAVDDDGLLRVRGRARIDPLHALAGRPVGDGVWDLRCRMRFAGWNRTCTVRVPHAPAAPAPVLAPLIAPDGRAVQAFVPSAGGELTLDVGQWSRTLASAVAPHARLAVDGARRLVLHLDVVTTAAAPPVVELLLEPAVRGDAGLVVAAGPLEASGDGSSVRFTLPDDAPTGTWKPWLRLREDVSVPERLPWLLHVADDGVTVTAAAS